jgi:hypothetical protein
MITRQSTARTILVGPVLDSAGAAKTDEGIGSIKITKNGVVGNAHGDATLTHDHAGKYLLALTASDTDTVGVLEISLNSGTNDMPVKGLNVVETAIWDALFADGATGLLPANVTHFGGNAGTFTDGIPVAELDSATLTKIDNILEDTNTTLPGLIEAIEGGGDATEAKQDQILATIQGSGAIQVPSPNVQGNLVLTQGDDYDGVANPRAQWNVTTNYTTGWTVRLTIRDKDDAVIYTNTGSVVSATVVAVTIAAPTGLEMTGCPGQWQGKFDVELTHSTGKKKTIALGVCYINEDQTR